MAVYSENRIRHKKTLCGQKQRGFSVKSRGTLPTAAHYGIRQVTQLLNTGIIQYANYFTAEFLNQISQGIFHSPHNPRPTD